MLVRRRASAVAVLAVALLAGLLALLSSPASAAGEVFISEVHYDNVGADANEGVEIEAPAGTDLTGWKVYLYNGGTGATMGKSYAPTTTLSGVVPAAGVLTFAIPAIQNGNPDGIALVQPDGTTVTEFISYGGTVTATDGPAVGTTSIDMGVAESSATPVGQSLQKINGVWTGPATNTFGTKNVPIEPDPGGTCTGTGFTHTIAEVQGTGSATPVPGAVKVEGIVTADLSIGGYNGVYIQTAGTGGASHAVAAGTASTGIFVYFGTDTTKFPDIAIGDRVEVSGNATEFNGLTQITTATKAATAVCESGVALPATTPLTFPLDDASRESAESMLVAPSGTTTVSDVFNTNRFGEIVFAAGDQPAPIPTDLFPPGTPEALAQKSTNALNRYLLDDGRTLNLTSAGQLPPYFSAASPLRVGDQVDAFGPVILSFGFSEWRLQPTTPVTADTPPAGRTTFASTNPRTPAPADVGGDLKVGSFNVLNYFIHFGGEARGAANEAELAKQEAKIVSAITALDADVVALEEIENSVKFDTAAPQGALERLVGALNTAQGAGTWDYVRTPANLPPASGQDVITTAIIYKPALVTPTGPSQSINDESVWFNAREPIAQTFTANDTIFTVVANHLKSKSPGSNPPTTGDNADTGDGQGAFNGDRVRQADSLAAFVEGLKTSSGSDDVLLFGDFNAYTQEDPMRALYGAGYLDVASENPTGHHSYVFGGQEGSLDHALASPSLDSKITGFDIWEINAHESFAFQYDGLAAFYDPGPYRASDHNPEIVGLDTTAEVPATVELQLLGINDFHGRLESPSSKPAPDGRKVGGAAQLAGLVDQLRTENPNTGFVSAGDNIGASTFISAVDDDNPTLDALDAAGLDVSAVGNHEFDKGFADLDGRVQDRADFPYLGANVYRDGARVLDPYFVQTIGGIDVGYIGVVTEQTRSLVSPDGIVGLEFRDPVAEATTVAGELKDGNPDNGEADVVVLLAHEGAAKSTTSLTDLETDPVFGRFVNMTADVDVIFSGHTHQEYALEGAKPGGGTRPLVQTGDYGEKLGKVTVTVDTTTKDVTGSSAALIEVVGYPENAAVAQIVADAKANSAVLGAEVIGSITADILRDPNRATESDLGNFIADVQLDATKDAGRGGAEIAFMNPGGIRADLLYAPNGEITYSEAFDVQPFANDVVTKSYTGAEVKAVLEQQWQPAGASRPLLWLGVSKGFTYTYNPDAAQGSRINASSMKLNGITIDPAAIYRVTVNSFLAAGGDNFTVLAGGTNRVTTGDNDLTMLVEYFRANSPVTADTVKRTSIQRPPPPYAPFESWDDLVIQQYRDVGGRSPNPMERGAWSAALEAGTRTPDQLVIALLNVDVNATESTVLRLYDGLLKRPPTQYWFTEWVRRLKSGRTVASAATEFLKAPDSPYKGLSNAAYVDALYRNVLRKTGDPKWRNIWTTRLNNGSWTRGAVAREFVEGPENKRLTTIDLKAIELYRTLLRRLPTRSEYTPLLASIRNGSKTLNDVAEELLASEEYAARFA